MNLICNSSFETASNPGVPDYWGTYHWGVWQELPCVRFEQWRTQWAPDEQQKFTGKRSFKITSLRDRPQKDLCLTSCQISTSPGPNTFSVYLKSDRPGVKAVLEIMNGWGGSLKKETVTLSDNWKRYSVTEDLKTSRAMVSVYPQGKGTIWIDAAQMEYGETAAPYQSSPLDAPLNTVPVNYGIASRPPVMDGTVNSREWEKAASFKLLQNSGSGEVVQPTDVYLLGDDENLYIGVKCVQPQIKSFHNNQRASDEQLWRNKDSMQIFISPHLDAMPYYQIVFDWMGNRFDSRSANPDWDGVWQVKTARDDQGWSAEVAIPWAMLKQSNGNSDVWRLNICRENRAGKENTSLFPLRAMFHTPRRFGYLANVPAAKLDKIKLDILKTELVSLSPGQYKVNVQLKNTRASKQQLHIVTTLSTNTTPAPVVTEINTEVPAGQNQELTVGKFTLKKHDKYLKVKIEVFAGKRLCAAEIKNFCRQPDLTIQLQPDLSYYTNEQTLEIKASTPYKLPATDKVYLKVFDANNQAMLDKTVELADCVKLDLAKLAPGVYKLHAELVDKDKTSSASNCRSLVKLPSSAIESKLDLGNKCLLVNGKPFMPLAIHWEMPIDKLSLKILESIRQLGFNSISIQFRPTANPDQVEQTLNRIEQAGLKCLFAFWAKRPDEKYLKTLETFIGRFKSHPAIIAWFTLDEPDGWNGYEFAEKAYRLNKKLDPYRPAFINYTPNHNFNMDLPTDIRALDHYPVPDQDIMEIPFHVEKMARAGQPVWIALQTTGNAYFYYREPNPGEFEFMTFSSLIKGASGFIYFAQLPHSKSLRDAMSELFGVLDKYTPMLLAAPWRAGHVKTGNTAMLATREYKGEKYIIALNKSDSRQDIEFEISGGKTFSQAKELISNKKIMIKNNKFFDNYAAFEYKVYKLED